MINITDKWSSYTDPFFYFFEDSVLYNAYEKNYLRYCHNKYLCDCKGQVFKIVGRRRNIPIWRKVFRFLPNVYRDNLVLQKTNKTIDIEQLREFVINNIQRLQPNECTDIWINELKSAKTYKDIICA